MSQSALLPQFHFSINEDVLLIYEQYFSATQSSIRATRINGEGNFAWDDDYAMVSSIQSGKVHMDASNFNSGQWAFVWEDDHASIKDIYAQNLLEDGSLGIYVPPTFTLSLLVNPEDGGTVEGEGEYQQGELVTISPQPNEGYIFLNWTDPDGIELGVETELNLYMPEHDLSLSANFQSTANIEQFAKDKFLLFPNPAQNQITIKTAAIAQEIRITDITGQVKIELKSLNHSIISIDTSELKPGIYIISLKSEHLKTTGKLTIIR